MVRKKSEMYKLQSFNVARGNIVTNKPDIITVSFVVILNDFEENAIYSYK